jgi:hypothetical protein
MACLADHPHDDTPALIARRLGLGDPEDVAVALYALEEDHLVVSGFGHFQLSASGWREQRADEAA